jgi:hypothetical protein
MTTAKARAAMQHGSLAPIFAEHMSRLVRYGFINGLPGFVTIEQDDTLQTIALEIEDGKIAAIYVMRNDRIQAPRLEQGQIDRSQAAASAKARLVDPDQAPDHRPQARLGDVLGRTTGQSLRPLGSLAVANPVYAIFLDFSRRQFR